jgi:hypothetical protein
VFIAHGFNRGILSTVVFLIFNKTDKYLLVIEIPTIKNRGLRLKGYNLFVFIAHGFNRGML